MKAQIFIDGKLVFSSNRISLKNLTKKENELMIEYGIYARDMYRMKTFRSH